MRSGEEKPWNDKLAKRAEQTDHLEHGEKSMSSCKSSFNT